MTVYTYKIKRMKNNKEILKQAESITTHLPTLTSYVIGFKSCRDEIAEIIKDTPNDADLGRKLRTMFLKSKSLE